MSNTEKRGGPIRDERSFQNLKNMYSSCNLTYLRSKGNKYSWVGNRYQHTIQSCLDRVAVNTEWLAYFPTSEANFLGLYGSDHRPVVTHIAFVQDGSRRKFRFDKRLLQQPNFRDYVANGWHSFQLRPKFSITDQLRECRKSLARCHHDSQMNSAKWIEELKFELEISLTSSGSKRDQIPVLQCQLAAAFRAEETYWHQKSRNNWVIEGDRNTKFFKCVQK